MSIRTVGFVRLGLAMLVSLSLLSAFGFQAAHAVPGTGTLFMYSNNTCTSLLPQTAGGNKGYLLPSTGTTVYVKITGITESSVTTIDLQYSGVTDEVLSTTVSGGSTTCVAWVVGTFGSTSGFVIACGTTGIVFYGTTAKPNSFQTNSNGGSDGGHFYGPGTDSSGNCAHGVPEFPSFGLAGVLAIAIPILFIVSRSRKPI